MKLTSLLFTATQIAVALSASPAGRPSPDDGRGTVNATDLAEGGTHWKPARAGTGPTTAATATATAGENAAPRANGAGLPPTREVVRG